MDDRDWVLIDVETAGLSSPVVVELAAQQHGFNILQGLGRAALEDPLANKTLHVQRCTADQQNPLGFVEGGRRQLALRVLGIMHFNAGAPALALRGGIEQRTLRCCDFHSVLLLCLPLCARQSLSLWP